MVQLWPPINYATYLKKAISSLGHQHSIFNCQQNCTLSTCGYSPQTKHLLNPSRGSQTIEYNNGQKFGGIGAQCFTNNGDKPLRRLGPWSTWHGVQNWRQAYCEWAELTWPHVALVLGWTMDLALKIGQPFQILLWPPPTTLWPPTNIHGWVLYGKLPLFSTCHMAKWEFTKALGKHMPRQNCPSQL